MQHCYNKPFMHKKIYDEINPITIGLLVMKFIDLLLSHN